MRQIPPPDLLSHSTATKENISTDESMLRKTRPYDIRRICGATHGSVMKCPSPCPLPSYPCALHRCRVTSGEREFMKRENRLNRKAQESKDEDFSLCQTRSKDYGTEK